MLGGDGMGLHVAVIGGGFVGRVHLEAMLGHPAVSAVSLAESDEAALAELAGRYPLARATTDYRALIDDPAVDIVDICLPHDLHHPVALEAFAAGRHVIADKPIANTLAEADEMMAAAEAAGRRFFVALNERFLPVHQRVGELLAQGFLGRPSLALLVVAGSELPRLRLPGHWKGTWDRAGGGALADSGTHLVDLAHAWFGPPVAVRCHLARHVVEAPDRADDTAALLMEYPGLTVNVVVSYAAARPALERDPRPLERVGLAARPTRGRRAPGRLEGRPAPSPGRRARGRLVGLVGRSGAWPTRSMPSTATCPSPSRRPMRAPRCAPSALPTWPRATAGASSSMSSRVPGHDASLRLPGRPGLRRPMPAAASRTSWPPSATWRSRGRWRASTRRPRQRRSVDRLVSETRAAGLAVSEWVVQLDFVHPGRRGPRGAPRAGRRRRAGGGRPGPGWSAHPGAGQPLQRVRRPGTRPRRVWAATSRKARPGTWCAAAFDVLVPAGRGGWHRPGRGGRLRPSRPRLLHHAGAAAPLRLAAPGHQPRPLARHPGGQRHPLGRAPVGSAHPPHPPQGRRGAAGHVRRDLRLPAARGGAGALGRVLRGPGCHRLRGATSAWSSNPGTTTARCWAATRSRRLASPWSCSVGSIPPCPECAGCWSRRQAGSATRRSPPPSPPLGAPSPPHRCPDHAEVTGPAGHPPAG